MDTMKLVTEVGHSKADAVQRLLRGEDASCVQGAQGAVQKTVTVDQSCRPAAAPYGPCRTFCDLQAAVAPACETLCARLERLQHTACRLVVKYRIFNQPGSCVSRSADVPGQTFLSPPAVCRRAMSLYRDLLAAEPLHLSRIILTAADLQPRGAGPSGQVRVGASRAPPAGGRPTKQPRITAFMGPGAAHS